MKNNKIAELDKVYNIDAREILETIPSGVLVSTTITSPPYYDMKDYGSPNQIGFGQTYEEYLLDLKEIFKKIFEITKDTGTLWIVIDTFKRNNQVVSLPFDLANKLKEIGWLLQDVIIWKKDKTVPWSNNGFMQRKFEYILFLSKSTKFKSNRDKVRVFDTAQLKKWWVKYPERYNPKGKALDEVWEFPIPIQGSWGEKYIRHFCPLPNDMVATMIQLSTDESDIVLDPFAGSGTVLSQSAYMKRNFIGFELNNEYIKMFNSYLKKTLISNRKQYELQNQNVGQDQFEKTILDLRSLKYAKSLLHNIQKESNQKNFKIFVEPLGMDKSKNKLIKVKYELCGLLNTEPIKASLEELIKKKPFSKFGIVPVFKFSKAKPTIISKYYSYTETNTYSYIKDEKLKVSKGRILSNICVDIDENDYL